MPEPNVDSVVIRIDVNQQYQLEADEENFFFRLVKAGFSQRRKTVANAVSAQMGIPKETVYTALRSVGLPENVRMESLKMEEIIEFSANLRGVF